MVAEYGASPRIDPESEKKLLLTISEAAYRLGMGRSFVYELVMRGDIPSIRLGRARRIPVASLEQFVASRMKAFEAEMESSR